MSVRHSTVFEEEEDDDFFYARQREEEDERYARSKARASSSKSKTFSSVKPPRRTMRSEISIGLRMIGRLFG